MSDAAAPRREIPDTLLARLREDLVLRRIDSGMQCLEANKELFAALEPAQKNAAALLGYLAQWVDIGFADTDILKQLLARFSRDDRLALSLLDYVHLRMVDGLIRMEDEDFDSAITQLQFVLSVEQEVRDTELIAIANFWIGRCLRKQGRYDDAIGFTMKGAAMARDLGYDKMGAVMRVLESWLAFQKGRLKESVRLLQGAEATLSETDDYITRGNIQSAYGRIARREGRYDQALQHFSRAIEEYKKRDPQHGNLARSLINMAFVERTLALQLQIKIDEEAVKRTGRRMVEERARYQQLRDAAMAHLAEGAAIYQSHRVRHGLGAVHLNYGFLHLDAGELDRAGAEAAEAYRLGEDKRDYIQMARARILQCMVENAKFDEQIGEKAELGYHAELARDFALDAVEYSRHTQNRRLLARACVWQGLTFANDFFNNPDAARQCCDMATSLLKTDGGDYLWDDLQALKGKVLRSGQIDSVLQEWSQGLVGDKSFQQITEEFAGIIIPKVWEREGRKISRVAARLSISPKKIRRILANAGLK